MTLTPDPTYKPHPNSRRLRYVERSVDMPESGTARDGALFRIRLSPPLDKLTTTYNRGFVRERDRYPPLPSNAGFNAFGPLTKIALHDAVGSVSIGDDEISWSTPRTLRLEDVRDFQNVASGQTAVSVPMVASNRSADLQFSAVGKVTIGGRSYSSASQSAAHGFTVALTVIGLVSGLLGIGAFVATLFRLGKRTRGTSYANARR